MDSAGVSISVSPTLTAPFKMSFDEYFEKSFTFSIERKDKPMSIKVVGQNEFPFIDT